MTAMGWFITADVGEFLTEAGEFLRAEPARHSVVLTVTENLLLTATAAPGPGPDEPSFGWWQPDPVTAVAAVFMYTPEFPVLLSSHMSGSAAAEISTLRTALAACKTSSTTRSFSSGSIEQVE